MEQLKKHLLDLVKELDKENREQVLAKLERLSSVYPFNEYEFLASTLLGHGKISLSEYQRLRDEYVNRNAYLRVFEISAPRAFGESWAQTHLKQTVPALVKPSKKEDSSYAGEYDFLLRPKIKIEVKASRAVDANSDKPLYMKALSSDSTSSFWMNFQQVKPGCCDVFVLIAVWRDKVRYWVLSSYEMANNKHYSQGQHRGNVGEGQIHFREDNISDFDAYESEPENLENAIRGAFQRN